MAAGAAGPDKRVLIVDDDRELARSIETTLVGAGFDVHRAEDGEEGLAKTIALCPDVIVTGRTMPKLSGTEMTERLRSGQLTGAIPIIMLSAMPGPEERMVGFAAGADLYLTEPFDPAELVAHVQRLAHGGDHGDAP